MLKFKSQEVECVDCGKVVLRADAERRGYAYVCRECDAKYWRWVEKESKKWRRHEV